MTSTVGSRARCTKQEKVRYSHPHAIDKTREVVFTTKPLYLTIRHLMSLVSVIGHREEAAALSEGVASVHRRYGPRGATSAEVLGTASER